ncbi:hypothetical protein AZ34_01745 [Hylemonella gracilis str. Niagara R]|uniref:Uncharacterized protein n=1 Tax=Hylemonella gracilis str. Niagara R TaxID=1458275 RepID=A0A016XEB8_9BURK|nr:hypothetical protein [Hylemonella gracilis]EYC49922.1 hypothetical protein AZ34_01745 [Hylemonella gracilis str. Niagara R]
MDTIIAYVDDAEYALQQLAPVLNDASGASRQPVQWIVVACPPRMSRHINKWVNHTARENWRNKWADKLFKLITPRLQVRGGKLITLLSTGPLPEMTQELQAKHGAARVLDVRRPKFDQAPQAITGPSPGTDVRRATPGALGGMAAFLLLASE